MLGGIDLDGRRAVAHPGSDNESASDGAEGEAHDEDVHQAGSLSWTGAMLKAAQAALV